MWAVSSGQWAVGSGLIINSHFRYLANTALNLNRAIEMKNATFLVLLCTLLVSCSDTGGNTDGSSGGESEMAQKEEKGDAAQIILTDSSIADIPLPFPREEMLPRLESAFEGYTVTKEIGQQDGPDFPLYEVMDGEETIMFFAMHWEDTFRLEAVHVQSSVVVDEYGNSVGDGLEGIWSVCRDELRSQRDYHGRVYAQCAGMRLLYQLEYDQNLPDTAAAGMFVIPEEEVSNWTITEIQWR